MKQQVFKEGRLLGKLGWDEIPKPITKLSAEWVRNGKIGEQGVLRRWSQEQRTDCKES